MKKTNFKLLALLLGIFVMLLSVSCDKDDPIIEEGNPFLPVLDQNFSFVVTGNDVVLTTTLSGNVWFSVDGVDYPTVDKTVSVNIPLKGTYSFTCSSLGSGATLTSEEFEVEILQDDISAYQTEEWINLTGGFGEEKAWVLDVEGKVFPGPLSFLGTSWNFVTAANDNEDDAWAWDPAASWTFVDVVAMEAPGTEGYGVMYFNLIDGTNFRADKKKEDAETGTYNFDWDAKTISLTNATILRSYKPNAEVNDDPNCEGDDCATHTEEGMNGISDWVNYKIYELSDTTLRLAVLRDQDVQGEGAAWLIYNFISKAHDDATELPEEFTYTEAVNTAYDGNDLVGTWKYADVPQGWIGYHAHGNKGTEIIAHLFGLWDTRDQVVTDLVSWGATDAEATFTANDANEYVFNDDGTCTLNGVANTYTYTDGIITFGTALVDEFSVVWITLTGTELKIIDVKNYGEEQAAYTPLGLWIGQQNGEKSEYQAVQLVKQ